MNDEEYPEVKVFKYPSFGDRAMNINGVLLGIAYTKDQFYSLVNGKASFELFSNGWVLGYTENELDLDFQSVQRLFESFEKR